jgi:hypothetical protein
LNKLFAGTTIGNTRYLNEWLCGIQKLNPSRVVISVDHSRHDPIENAAEYELIEYDTGEMWGGYETRHKGWMSDYSIGLGIKDLIECFIKSDCSHFLCTDSDVVLNEDIAKKILKLDYHYLQIGVPAASRRGLSLISLHWKSTNFGLNRETATKLYPILNYNVNNSSPVDLKLHTMIRSLDPTNHFKVKSSGVVHYLNSKGKTRKVSTLEAQIKGLCTKPLVLVYEIFRPPVYRTRNA